MHNAKYSTINGKIQKGLVSRQRQTTLIHITEHVNQLHYLYGVIVQNTANLVTEKKQTRQT